MADAKKSAKNAAQDEKAPSLKKRKLLPYALVGGLMTVEGIGLYVAIKMFGGSPEPSHAELVAAEHGAAPEQDAAGAPVEIPITEIDVLNSATGRALLYRIQICISAKKEQEQKLRDLVTARQNTIQDRIQTIMRSATPQQITEPGLETLKTQFRHELEETLGVESGIDEVLIPKLLQARG